MNYNKLINNFITDIIDNDVKSGLVKDKVRTRFPPEPNGYLHIGHAKSICLNFGIALKYKGTCNLRFDDTNPTKENTEYVKSIIKDVNWLGFDCQNKILYASDYFDKMYQYALQLIQQGSAYVDDQDAETIKLSRGTLNKPGIKSPYRSRTVEKNLVLFKQMKSGNYKTGEKVLRAKIDMSSPNMNMRDPIIYRILHKAHHRTGNNWCIYPMYDWAHGLEDSIEEITHSICTLEFEDHRPLYDWFLKQLQIIHPKQVEFARLNLEYTIMSKRQLKILVEKKQVSGWDDPRMPTISGLRKRGFTPLSIKEFIYSLGVGKNEGIASVEHLEYFARKNLNQISLRVMAILNPVKLIIDNYDSNSSELLEANNNPEITTAGTRKISFGKELYIEREDFLENPTKKFFRLSIGSEVRLMHAYYIKCTQVIKNSNNEIIEIHCTYDPNTRGGWSTDGRKVKGTIHWVCANNAIDAEIRIYDKLFNNKNLNSMQSDKTFLDNLNNKSLQIIPNAKLEAGLVNPLKNQNYQFVRKGYFILDKESTKNHIIFNRTVTLKDSWEGKKNK